MENRQKQKQNTWGLNFALTVLLFSNLVQAQITSDGTLATIVNQTGQDISITGGSQFDTNLFHSFGVFDVVAGETATFSGPADVSNIIGRVTGGFTSNIDGGLNSSIDGANLYLINPAGVVFGTNATLGLQGSFHVSTADYLTLGTNGRFDATINPANSVLNSAAPSAFGFVSNTPTSIDFNGSDLRTPMGETISVIGGDINITDAFLYAKEGRINIASVGSAGEVTPTVNGLETNGFTGLGDINVSYSKIFFTRSRDTVDFSLLGNIDASGDGSGNIYIRGNNFVADNGAIFSDTRGNGSAGIIDIALEGELRLRNEARIVADSFADASGAEITINANTIVLESGGEISTSAFGSGRAGNVTVNAIEAISISGSSSNDDPILIGNLQSSIGSFTGNGFVSNTGQGGDVSVTTNQLSLNDNGLIIAETNKQGNAGHISVTANEINILNGASIANNSRGTGNAGGISVQANNLRLTDGGQIISANLASGQGGNIQTIVTDTLSISGSGSFIEGTKVSGLLSFTTDDGASGDIEVTTSTLQMDDLGTINTSTSGAGNGGNILVGAAKVELNSGARISSSTGGAGAGSQITVDASEHIKITGTGTDGFASGFYSDVQTPVDGLPADASGNGGNIALTAPLISLNNSATVSAKSNGTGNAGTIDIVAASTLELLNNSSITTESLQSGGGKINVDAKDMLYLKDSKITSSVFDGAGNGGDITIDPEFVILDSSQILANADSGVGGNISITTDFLITSPDSIIDASANTGIDGEININSPDTDLTGSLTELPENFLNAEALLKQRCAARSGVYSSSFVVVGSGGVPASPDDLQYSTISTPVSLMQSKPVNQIMQQTATNNKPVIVLGCEG